MSNRIRGLLGLAFVLATVAAALVGLAGSWGEIVAVVAELPWWRVLAAFALASGGVALTSLVWSRALTGCGFPLPVADTAPMFFLGQLGKYLPGSVWSIGAVAVLLRRRAVPVQASVASSLIFLVLHFAPGLVLAGALVLGGHTRLPGWSGLAVGLVGLVLLTPAVLRPLGTLLNRGGTFAWRWTDTLTVSVTMGVVWTMYAVALLAAVPDGEMRLVPTLLPAFVLAFALGVAVPFAPAGVGVREAVLIHLLTPPLGFETAAAVTLLSRVTHTAADLALGGLAPAVAHRTRGVV